VIVLKLHISRLYTKRHESLDHDCRSISRLVSSDNVTRNLAIANRTRSTSANYTIYVDILFYEMVDLEIFKMAEVTSVWLKVIGNSDIGYSTVVHCNYVSILTRFRDIAISIKSVYQESFKVIGMSSFDISPRTYYQRPEKLATFIVTQKFASISLKVAQNRSLRY